MNKEIYCPVGIAASGKSTYTLNLMNEYSGFVTKVLNADFIRKELYGDPKIQGNGKVVFGLLLERYEEVLRDEITKLIIIDNTSLTYAIRMRYWEMAHAYCPLFGHTFDYTLVYFEPNLARSLMWNSKRDRVVPPEVIERQFNTIQDVWDKEIERYTNVIRIK